MEHFNLLIVILDFLFSYPPASYQPLAWLNYRLINYHTITAGQTDFLFFPYSFLFISYSKKLINLLLQITNLSGWLDSERVSMRSQAWTVLV